MRVRGLIGVAVAFVLCTSRSAEAHTRFYDNPRDLPPPPWTALPERQEEGPPSLAMKAEQRPFVFRHYHLREDGTVEVTGEVGLRGHV